MGRRFQSGHSIVLPTPTVLNGTDGGPRTVLVVGKVNTSAYQALIYTRSSGAHGWWAELDTTGGLHVNYGTGTTNRPVGSAATGSAAIWTMRKDNGGSVQPIGRHFTGASFATDSGDVTAVSTLIDGTAIDGTYGVAWGRWGNTGSDYSDDWEHYFTAVWNSLVPGATLAGLTKTKAGILLGSPDYWMSCEGSSVTDSAGGTATITGTTVVSDPAGFFSSGYTAALPTVTETSSVIALGRSKRGTLAVVGETSSARTLAGSKAKALPTLGETSTSRPIVGSKSGTLARPSETDTARTLAGAKSGALARSGETSTSRPIVGSKAKVLPVTGETSTAVELHAGGIVKALPMVTEMSTAQPLVGSKRDELPPVYEYSTALVLAGGSGGDGVMKLGAVMDEIAARLRLAPSLAGRTFAYPPASLKAPAAIVTYPSEIEYDASYRRGADRIDGEVVVVVGRPTERQSRDRITKYVDGSGPESVKALLDGRDYASASSVRVTKGVFDVVTIGGVDYLAAVFSLDIVGKGALAA